MDSNNDSQASIEDYQQKAAINSMYAVACSRALTAYKSALVLNNLVREQDLSTSPLLQQEERLESLPAPPFRPPLKTTASIGGSNILQAPAGATLVVTTGSMLPAHPFGSLITSAGFKAPPAHPQTSRAVSAATPIPPPVKNREETMMQTMMHVVGGVSESFPMVLHRALTDLAFVPGGTDIATFLPSGTSFQIRNQYLFETRVLPFFFPNMKSFASFQRQLNFYSFKRITGAGVDRGAYRHDMFLRDFHAMSSHMKRSKIKKGGPRGKPKTSSNKCSTGAQEKSGRYTSSPELERNDQSPLESQD